jgi:hypothetical protein
MWAALGKLVLGVFKLEKTNYTNTWKDCQGAQTYLAVALTAVMEIKLLHSQKIKSVRAFV